MDPFEYSVINVLAFLEEEFVWREVADLKPALPKYDAVWDPSIVLGYLVTAYRAQTLALIEVENIVKVDDGVEIKIPAKLKTSRRNRLQPSLYLPSFADNPAKPFHAVSSQSVSRWIKNTLTRSGINTEVFSAHSTRHAATSSAKRRGVSLDIIRQAAGWSAQSETFAEFYDKPLIDKSTFAKILALKLWPSSRKEVKLHVFNFIFEGNATYNKDRTSLKFHMFLTINRSIYVDHLFWIVIAIYNKMLNKLLTQLSNNVTISNIMKLYKHWTCLYEELFIISINMYNVVRHEQFQKSF
ncbi:hypothetical protein NQ315_006017 [Exocentrus adspersus]|uniref:Tyr recombinase domain-containing protein n=1 Tax=Exocentrus adspersus TaxID=1586481 RepID=A0AAV8V7L4_9CUCU|nr:hypothetical protein NQ315_006017 [Exocentrus adspersus]